MNRGKTKLLGSRSRGQVYGPSVTPRMHRTIQAVMETKTWRAALLIWFPPQRRKQDLVGWDSEFTLQSPRSPVWHQSLSQPTQTLFDSPSALEGVKMHYRLQVPPFSSSLIKLHQIKLQLKGIRKKELMVLIPSLSSFFVSWWCSSQCKIVLVLEHTYQCSNNICSF